MTKAKLPIPTKNIPVTLPLETTVSGFTMLVTAWQDYKKTHEVESTKRAHIAAARDIRVEELRQRADILRLTVMKTFEERAHNFDQFFTMLESGFDTDDDRKINAALTMIVEQVKANPMAQASQMISAIQDPNVDVIDV